MLKFERTNDCNVVSKTILQFYSLQLKFKEMQKSVNDTLVNHLVAYLVNMVYSEKENTQKYFTNNFSWVLFSIDIKDLINQKIRLY